jgi:hypothetical protein
VQLVYYDLGIPARQQSRFTGRCQFSRGIELEYVLPHYHSTGNFFELAIERDDEPDTIVIRRGAFNASPLGQTLASPVLVDSRDRVRFTCGYDNWYDRDLSWGIGIDEMCVVFALGRGWVSNGIVAEGTELVDVIDDVRHFEGPCQTVVLNAGNAFARPRAPELHAPLYIPPDFGSPTGAQRPVCEDADLVGVEAPVAPTLANVVEHVFEPWCAFSGCHGEANAFGLDLREDDGLLQRLLSYQPEADVPLPLISPGHPEGSWLYRLMTRCEPRNADGNAVAHMPRNAPILLDPKTLALVRDWIIGLEAP